LSPSAHSGRAALSEAAGLERSRFGVVHRSPALADLEIGVLALAVLRSAENKRRCSHDGYSSASFARVIHLSAPRQARRINARRSILDIFDRPRGCDRCIRTARSTPIRSCKRHRRVSAARLGSCADALLCAAFRYPIHADDRGLAGTTGPSLNSPGGARGVQPFAGSFPPHGWLLISELPDPHAFSSRRPTRFVFVGLARFAVISKS
jgi:hypothetical protein